MKMLSTRCKLICLAALLCLGLGVALAPRVEVAPARVEQQKASPAVQAAKAAADPFRPVQNCTGGDSVNCHTRGNRAGL